MEGPGQPSDFYHTSRATQAQKREYIPCLGEESSPESLHIAPNTSQCLEGALKCTGYFSDANEGFKFCVVSERKANTDCI